jgi:L,D-transpeptidase ErfK/SrfK
MRSGKFKIVAWIFVMLLYIIFLSALFFYVLPNLNDNLSAIGLDKEKYPLTTANSDANVAKLRQELKELHAENPKGEGENYIVINTTENSFKLYKEGKLIRTGLCSTGKDELLIGPDGKKFVFKTPRGVFTVKSKMEDPVWVRPDWDFIEQGQKTPSPRSEDRYDYATLGKYKLELGDGYKIHGTLYQRLIGMPVTHGCIRLLDDDLEAVYQTLPKKSKVYIF